MKKEVKVVTIIPARLSSTRLKDKPLSNLNGKTLVQRVWENAAAIEESGEVVVATDSEKIKKKIDDIGGNCVLTPENLSSGSDRVYYTADKYFPEAQIVVNLQGDEPFIDRKLVSRLIRKAIKGDCGLYSAYYPVTKKEAEDDSAVKVVLDYRDEALYFSRRLIPYGADTYKKHIGIYIWKRSELEKFYTASKGKLEETEKLEQLRVLEYGGRIKMIQSPSDSLGIDTPADLDRAVKYLKELEGKKA